MSFQFDIKGVEGIARLKAFLGDASAKVPKEIAIALNKTAKAQKPIISKAIRSEVAVTAKAVKQQVAVSVIASPSRLSATVQIKRNKRPSLKEFKARQTKLGVTYKISKKTGRGFVKSAFISDKLNSHVFTRSTKKRLPISKLKGPSIAKVYEVNKMFELVNRPDIADRFEKELARRLQFNIYKRKKKAGLY